MRPRSIGFRLAALFSLLLLAGLISLGAVLWFGVQYNMVSAVDGLLEDRAANLVKFVNAEFGNVFAESGDDRNQGEFRGRIEQVDAGRHWIAMSGSRIQLRENTKFEGSLRAPDLRAGQFGEVEVERQGAGSPWTAKTVGVVTDLRKELREMLHEYALAAPDGRLLQLRALDGASLLPARTDGEWRSPVAWRNTLDAGFSTIETAHGPYRLLDRELPLAGGRYRLQSSSSLAALSATRDGLLRWIWWAIPTALLLSLCGGYLISRAALRPLERFAGVASRISANRLSERLEAPATGDVVERLARTFNGMLERLESSVNRLDQFTADASHELRGPVAVIRTTAELAVRQNRANAGLREDMRGIHGEAARLTDLIDDLLTLARSDSGQAAAPMTQVDLGAIVDDVAGQFRRQVGAARIQTEVAEGARIVRGQAPALKRLLVILVDNAVRHTPEDASIRVAVGGDHEERVLSVADTGHGIPASELPRLFDRFYRADPSRNRSPGGFGLGLAIAKCIAESHGGRISVSSKLGEGSVFRVLLPHRALSNLH